MELKALKKIADKDSIKLSLDDTSGIVSVKFTIQGFAMNAQYSASVAGIYAFCVADRVATKFLKLLVENSD